MTPNHNEELRAKIIEAVPEILELKFGCEFHIYPEKGNRIIVQIREFSEDEATNPGIYYIDQQLAHWTEPMINFDKRIEIIGRPIQLADVLRALGKIESYFELGAIEDGRLLFKCDYESHNEYVYWNLALGLDGQTDEVKEFLWKIICSPK